MLAEFDSVVGLGRLRAIHLNDSKNPIASHKDRHEKIGEGTLGLEGLTRVKSPAVPQMCARPRCPCPPLFPAKRAYFHPPKEYRSARPPMNLCAAKPELREFARQTIKEDLARLELLPNVMFNFHPGSHVKQGAETGVALIAEVALRR